MQPLYEDKIKEISSLDNAVQVMQSFEILNEVVGSKYLELSWSGQQYFYDGDMKFIMGMMFLGKEVSI